MRWWVETTALEGDGEVAELAIEASSCGRALDAALGETRPAGALSFEVFGSGLRVIDRRANRRYVVLPAGSAAGSGGPAGSTDALAALLAAEGVDEPPPSYELVTCRDHDPTPELPLTYRERGVRVASNVTPEAAVHLLWHLLDELRRGAASLPPGKVFELAAFSGPTAAASPEPPLVALGYKDWRQEAEVVVAGGAPVQRFVLADPAFSGE